MFDQFKERLHHVQQDLSSGLKTLSTKAKEVKRSHRDEIFALKKDISPSVPTLCNHEVGAELLDRFQQMWSELHKEIEASAERALVVDGQVQEVFLNYERRAEPLVQLQRQLMDLPRFVENIQLLTASIGKLEAEFEEVESMMIGHEDLIGFCDLLRNKQTQTNELARYTQQRKKEEELLRVRLQEEYELSIRLKEESQKADKMERQKAFQDVFAADMQHYKTYGEMQRVVPADTPKPLSDVSSIENFQIAVNAHDQEALDDFLGDPPSYLETREAGALEVERVVDDGDDDDDDDDSDDDDAGGKALDVIEEESEREEKSDELEVPESTSIAEEDVSAEVRTSQEGQDEAKATTQGEPTSQEDEADEDDDDDEEEFDTPEEGSETETK